jgi:hypothetical protein
MRINSTAQTSTGRIAAIATSTLLALALAACGPSTDDGMSKTDSEPSAAMTNDGGAMKHDDAMDKGASRTGSFAGLNGKKVSGTVTVADGKVTLSGFSSDEGPDLHLYLTNGDDEAAVSAGKTLGKVSYDTASQSFELGSIDAGTYDTVVVHCDKAKAVFGAAGLSS